VETIRNPKTLARAVNMLSKFQENGSTKDYRGIRTSVIGIFENQPEPHPPQNQKPYHDKLDSKLVPGLKLPDLPSIPPHIDKKKSGAKTDRPDKDKKEHKKSVGEKKIQPSVLEKDKDLKNPEKKKRNRKIEKNEPLLLL